MTAPMQRDHDGTDGNQQKQPADRHPRRDRASDQPGGDECADGIKAAMRHVDDAHDAEDEAQARSNEEKNRGVKQRIEDLDDQYRH